MPSVPGRFLTSQRAADRAAKVALKAEVAATPRAVEQVRPERERRAQRQLSVEETPDVTRETRASRRFTDWRERPESVSHRGDKTEQAAQVPRAIDGTPRPARDFA
jgi:hypothetical protein